MKKLGIALGALVLLGGVVVVFGPGFVMRNPSLLGTLGRLLDPIGPNQPVVWDAGPETTSSAPAARPPNVIVILVDDLGWNDLTWRGGGLSDGAVPTPNIDSLARDGVQFTRGYAGNATCAPSRAALLTGRYPMRFGFESTPAPAAMGAFAARFSAQRSDGGPPVLFHEDLVDQVPPMNAQGVPPAEITVAELLRERGYHTVMLGKWHVGGSEGKRPNDQGFDEFLGFLSGGSMYLDPESPDVVNAMQDFDPIDQFIWPILPFAVRKDEGPRFTPDAYMTDYLSREAVRAIEANHNRPFFMYLAYNAPHTPLQATRSDYDALAHIDHHPTRVYGAMLRSLDRGVGQVLAALRANGLDDNTLVLFSSDNGGAHYVGIPGLNDPYRGWKMTFFEGGLHSPFFVKWPARLPKGKSVDTPAAHIDVLPTVAAAAGAKLPDDRAIDGIDLLPIARGESTSLERALFWRSGHYKVVLHDGWKLQVSGRPERRWLFHVSHDPTEQVNVADVHPEQVERLEALLDAHDAEIGPPGWPALVEAVIPVDRTLADARQPDEEWVYWPN